MSENKEIKVKKLPEYGTPGYEFDVIWHDEAKRDDLIVADAKPFAEVMNARAKGTTIYEMIDQFGGIDNLTQVLAVKEAEAVYADVSDVPEMANDAEYAGVLKKLQAQIDELKKSSKVEEKVEDPKTEGDIK